MPAIKTNTTKVFSLPTGASAGRDYQIDLKRRPYAIKEFLIRYFQNFTVPAAGATALAWAHTAALKSVRLSGSRPGGTDNIKSLTGRQISKLNCYDNGVDFPITTSPVAYWPTALPAGVYNWGCELKLRMDPARMNFEFGNLALLPGPLYSNLTLELFWENFANLFSSGGAGVTLNQMGFEIFEVDAVNVDVNKSKFVLFQETYQRESVTASGTVTVRPPLGNYFRQIFVDTYERASAAPDDFLIGDVELKENVSTIFSESWQAIRGRNKYDYNFSNIDYTFGSIMLDFATQGQESTLLDVSDFGYKGRDLKLEFGIIPAAPATRYIDTVSRVVIPGINA